MFYFIKILWRETAKQNMKGGNGMGQKEAYLQQAMKSDLGQMRCRLLYWGGALEICKRKQEEIKKLERLQQDAVRFVQEPDGERLGEAYRKQIQRISEEIEQILEEKRQMDCCIARLGAEEQNFLYLRYEKGYGYEYIAMKLHMSRASCFRLGNKAVEALLEQEEKRERKENMQE